MRLEPHSLSTLLLVSAGVACDQLPCRTNNECPVGMFCRIEERHCDYECLRASDCPASSEPGRRAICTNEGRCARAGRPPRLLVESPAQNSVFPFDTREVTVTGRVVIETERVEISVTARGRLGCVAESLRRVELVNPEPGASTELPFTLDGVPINPGDSVIVVNAGAGVAAQRYPVDVERTCVGCPEVAIEAPSGTPVLDAAFIPRLTGTVVPAPPVGARWRVTDEGGQVFDGPLTVTPTSEGAAFGLSRVPVFGGRNRVDVSAPVEGGFEGSCSTAVLAPPTEARSARAVLTWDTVNSDLDLVFIGPGATLEAAGGVVSPTRFDPDVPAQVLDDFDGLGPELLFGESLPDGAYGLAVEPIAGPGSSAVVRVLFEDRFLTERPLGPRFLSAARGDLWIVGALRIENGSGRFVEVDRVVSLDELPSRPPGAWPELW